MYDNAVAKRRHREAEAADGGPSQAKSQAELDQTATEIDLKTGFV